MNFKITTITLSLISIFSTSMVNASIDEKTQANLNSQQLKYARTSPKNYLTNFRPPGKSQPQYTVGGATRGNTCAIDQENSSEITALVPEKNQSLTLQSHPNFFAYVPQMDEDKSATLIVKDQAEDYYYSQKVKIPASGGIVKMTLAEEAQPLEVNKEYTWFLRIQCNAHLEPEDPLISASIIRVEGNIPDFLGQNDLVSFYANTQIWYDFLNSAFDLYQSGQDVYWSQLLNNIGMDRFASRNYSGVQSY